MIRKAKICDAKKIYKLINSSAKKGRMLERSLNSVYENIRDFWVWSEGRKVLGCCALHIVGWQDLAEIRSLVVAKAFHGKGIGSDLVRQCMKEAKEMGLKHVFALTFVDGFFKKLEFKDVDKKDLPHKVWSDCINCVSFFNCKEKAVMYTLKGVKNK
jgi:amino-acid N-acetyltransferase